MKQCDRNLSPFATIGSSSLSSFVASESDPEDSLWNDFTFDFSFLSSEDHKIFPNHDVPKEEESALRKKEDFSQPVRENSDSLLKFSNLVESDLKCVESQALPSLAVVSTSDFGSNVSQCFPLPAASVLGVTGLSPVVASDDSGYNGVEGRCKDESGCSGNVLVRKDISERNCSPLFSKMSALRINGFGIDKLNLCSTNRSVLSEKSSLCVDEEETEVDSPCWRGTRSHKSVVASGTKSLSFRRFSDDQNCLYGLNPLAPQFIPSNAKKNLDKNGREVEEKSFSSLKKSLSSTFSPLSGEFSITDPSEAENTRIGVLNHDVDESLGLVSQAMSMLDISNEFQKPKKLDPLAPVFVPACAKLSGVVHEKHGAEDHRIGIETNVHSTSAVSSSDKMLLNNVKVETNSSEVDVDHSLRNQYSHNVHEWGTTYSFNPQLRSQVQIYENTKLDGSSNKSHGRKKLNPLAPQFSLADNKQKVYGCEENRAGNDLPSMANSSVLVSPIGYRNHKELHAGFARSSVHMEPSSNEVCIKEMERVAHDVLHGNSSLKTQTTKVGDNFEHPPPFHMLETAVSSSSSHVKASFDFGDKHGCYTSSPSPKMDVKKILTTIHGLSELLTHAHSSDTSDSPDERYLDLINCTVQNLNSYINNRVQEHTANYGNNVHSSCDVYSLPNMCKQSIRDHHQLPNAKNSSANVDVKGNEKYSMVSGDMVPDSHFEFGVSKENGFGKVIGNHRQTEEEQISPQVFFYKSLWLKAKADRSLMEYETFLSKTRT